MGQGIPLAVLLLPLDVEGRFTLEDTWWLHQLMISLAEDTREKEQERPDES